MIEHVEWNGIMRLLLIFLLFTSCNEKVDPHQLSGSWKSRDVIDKTNLNASDRMTFYNVDSLKVEIFTNGKLFSQMKGTYKLDTVARLLTTIYNDTAFTFHIIGLNEEELELRDCGNRRIVRFVRDLNTSN